MERRRHRQAPEHSDRTQQSARHIDNDRQERAPRRRGSVRQKVGRIIGTGLPGDAAVFAPDEASAIPAWAQSAVSALSNAGIPLAASDYEAPLPRREAANMLLAAAPAAEAAGLYCCLLYTSRCV